MLRFPNNSVSFKDSSRSCEACFYLLDLLKEMGEVGDVLDFERAPAAGDGVVDGGKVGGC